jgi:hypothetical protein
MLNLEQKEQIAALAQAHVDNCKSQNEAARALNVSSATLSQIKNRNWQSIDDKMWLKIGKQLGYSQGKWNTVVTRSATMLHVLLNDSANWGIVYGITGAPGCGKSYISAEFASANGNVFHIVCDEFWNKKQFLQEILFRIGEDPGGMNCNDMMGQIVNVMLGLENPLLILDEADKLNDPVLYLFITLYNRLEDKAGIILMATDHLEKRINKGLRLNRKGYKEIYSRVGRRFIKLPEVSEKDVTSICRANGVENSISITEVWNDCEGDLRRVKRKIHAIKNRDKKTA